MCPKYFYTMVNIQHHQHLNFRPIKHVLGLFMKLKQVMHTICLYASTKFWEFVLVCCAPQTETSVSCNQNHNLYNNANVKKEGSFPVCLIFLVFKSSNLLRIKVSQCKVVRKVSADYVNWFANVEWVSFVISEVFYRKVKCILLKIIKQNN